MYHDHPRDTTHRHATTTARALPVRLATVAAVPAALWALANPLAALLALAAFVAIAWHRRLATARRRPRPTLPPD